MKQILINYLIALALIWVAAIIALIFINPQR